MNERRMQFAVGVVTLGSVFIAAVLMMINSPIPGGLSPFGRSQYPLTIKLDKAPGVARDTPVRKNGVLIGRVTSVKDNAEDGVDVEVNIDQDRELTTHHVPHVRTTVLGDATIDFEVDPLQRTAERRPLTDELPVRGVVDSNPVEAISKLADLQDDIEGAMTALAQAGNSVNNLATRVQDAFGTNTEPGRMRRFLDNTETAMVQFGNAMASVNQILGDEAPVPGPGGQPPVNQPPSGQQMRQRLRQGLNDLPDTISETKTAMQEFRGVLKSADTNLQNLQGFTEPLGRNGPQIAQSIIDAVNGLDKLVEEFTLLATALNSREGTIGQLIHNRQLYENLNRLTINANEVLIVVYKLAERLRPIVEDARTFMNKIALEPGRILTGAFGEPSVFK